MVDLSFSRDCTNKNEQEKSLKKSIWPPRSRKWLGILTNDVSQRTNNPPTIFSQYMSRLFLSWLSQQEKHPKGCPLNLAIDVFHCYIFYYEVVNGPRVNEAPSDPLL